MDVAIHQVNTLTVHDLQRQLRTRNLAVTGIKSDLRARLIEALRTDYDDGWTCGYLLNIRCIPISGDGIDPRTLIGLHITGIDEARSRSNVKVSFSNGDSVFVFLRPTTTAADPVCVFFCDSAPMLKWPCTQSPMRILEIAMAERRNEGGRVSNTFLVLRLEGMGTRIYFGRDLDKGGSDTCLHGVYLAPYERYPCLEREEVLLDNSG